MSIFQEEEREAYGVIEFLYRNWKKLALAAIIGLVLGVGITFLMPNKYRSFGIIYPPNSYTRDKLISNPQFGHEQETEHLMQLLESSSMRDSVVERFNLKDYYEIDTSVQGWRETLNLRYIADVGFFRSKYLSVVISAETKDPELSANIVNYIIDAVNRYKERVFQANIRQELAFFKKRYDNSLAERDSVVSLIYSLKDTSDGNNLITNYKNRLAKDGYINDDFINTPRMEELVREYDNIEARTMGFKNDLAVAVDASKKPFLKNYVIDRAEPVYKKVSPSLMWNGLLGLLIVTGITAFFLMISARLKTLRSS